MTLKNCDKCGQEIKSLRSTEISTHFHSHITQIARELNTSRTKIYFLVLLLACEIETEGGACYPFEIVSRYGTSPFTGEHVLVDMVEPWRTSACTNKQLMTAVEAAHRYAALNGVELNEEVLR